MFAVVFCAHSKSQSLCSTSERIPELMCFSAFLCSGISLQHSCNQLYDVTTLFKDHTDIILHNGWKYLQRGEKMFFIVLPVDAG